MPYSDFSLREVLERFHLALVDVPDLFADIPEREPGPLLRALLPEFLPLALAINTEKARSELVIAPLLAALRAQFGHRFSFFSGIDFTVDSAQGLSGYCDFILSRSPEQQFLRSPVAVIVEAKNENLKSGLGQCAAALVGVKIFNEREGEAPLAVYGAVTSGSLWRFLRLEGSQLDLDQQEYHIRQLPKLVGVLAHILGCADPSPHELQQAGPPE
jgi:hypothetical protein